MGYKSNSPPLDAQCEVKIWPNCQYVSHCTAGFLHIKVRIDSLFRLLITEDTLGVRTGQKTGCSELSPLMKSHDAGIIRAIEQPSKLLIHHRPWHVLQCPESFLPSEWYWARVQSSAITFVVVLLWGFQSELHDSTNQWLGIHLEFKVSLICKKERKEKHNTKYQFIAHNVRITERDDEQKRTQTMLPLKSTKPSSIQLSITWTPGALEWMWESECSIVL